MQILIVDDDRDQIELLQGFLERQNYIVHAAEDVETAENIFSEQPVQIVLLDQRMPKLSGEELLSRFKNQNPLVKAIMITAYGSVDTAVQVMKLGAVDFLEKPIDLQELNAKLQELEESVHIEEEAAEVAASMQQSELPLNIIGNSPPMKQLLSQLKRIAPTPWTVLISGDTGTGKGLLAKLLHELSPRKEEPLIDVNCAAIPENLFESELFGHVKGAFTGAEKSKKGRFEQAHKGTLFLDEIGDLPVPLQAKILHALQENIISRVGSEENIRVDVRLIAATNRNLSQLVEQGNFREDLYYRLNVLNLELPALSERREDIPALLDHFLNRYSSGNMQFSEQALNTLVKYNFPGNVRELEHLVQRVSVLGRKNIIDKQDLPEEVRFYSASSQGKLKKRLEAVEKEMISSALKRNSGNQSQAASELGISERVIRYKLLKYNIK